MMPYLMPFTEFDVEAVINFNVNQIVSFSRPAKDVIAQYLKILKRFLDNDEDDNDLSLMKTPIVKH